MTILVLFILMFFLGIVFFMLSPTGKEEEKVKFEVKPGSTYYSLVTELKEENLIRSEIFFKLYLKIISPKNLDAGIVELNRGMSAGKIINSLSKRNMYNPDAVTITIPEGKQISKIAEIVASKTNTSKEEYLNYWNSKEFVEQAKNKYWFITDIVKKEGIRYPLEGYFFPSTYELQDKDVTPEYVAYKLLDQMEIVLNNYKKEIEKSKYSIHEILTLSSIVEYEGILDDDRALIAGVFYNRLEDGLKLQSCATLGYAIDEWKLIYTLKDMAVNNPYNTYYYAGFPPGPGNSPSEASIKATLYPQANDYYYFMADVCHDGYGEDDKTYFSKTLGEHESYARKYLNPCN